MASNFIYVILHMYQPRGEIWNTFSIPFADFDKLDIDFIDFTREPSSEIEKKIELWTEDDVKKPWEIITEANSIELQLKNRCMVIHWINK